MWHALGWMDAGTLFTRDSLLDLFSRSFFFGFAFGGGIFFWHRRSTRRISTFIMLERGEDLDNDIIVAGGCQHYLLGHDDYIITST